MNKVFASPREAVAAVRPGSSVAISGFGLVHRFPVSLIQALVDTGVKDLTLVCNSVGSPGQIRAALIENRQVTKLIAAFSARAGDPRSAVEEQIAAGDLEVELVPQGTLVERLRAAAAGLGGFYTPTGVGTPIARGKEVRVFAGRQHLFEPALAVDYAFIRAFRADTAGNLQFRGSSQNLNTSFAKAARTAIAEVDEIVDVGGIAPDDVGLPGIFVSGVVRSTVALNMAELMAAPAKKRPADKARVYNGKPGLTRSEVAARAARSIADGSYVNLGLGIPTLVSDHLAGRDVTLHAENGVMGYGEIVTGADIDPDHYDAGGRFVSLRPGASFFDSVTSFEMARSGKLTAVVLGAYQVDQDANLANWSTPEQVGGGIGGAMDLVSGGSPLIVLMEHTESRGGRPKLVRACTYPLTGLACVDTVVTDLCLLKRGPHGFVLEEVAPGFTVDEVLALTEMQVGIPSSVGRMSPDAAAG